MTTPSRTHRRTGLIWLVVVLVVVALAVGAWFAGEAIARSLVTNSIRDGVRAALKLPADQPMDVQIDGAVLPQLIGGSFQTVAVTSDDVTIGPLSGDLSATAHEVHTDGTAAAMAATMSLTPEELRPLLPTDRVQIDTITFDAPQVRFETVATAFALHLDIELALTPSAADGELVLTPAGFRLGGFEVTAQDLQNAIGGAADTVLQPWQVCIADRVPQGVTLRDVAVRGDRLIVAADIAGDIATNAALQQNGTCS